jgi:acyl-CoA thioesterase
LKNPLLQSDAFSQWLGITQVLLQENHCILNMEVRANMLNGYNVAHGGILFSLADSALAFAACNSGNIEVSMEAGIHFHKAALVGELLIAEAKATHKGKRTAVYDVTVKNQSGELKASFRATVFNTEKAHHSSS